MRKHLFHGKKSSLRRWKGRQVKGLNAWEIGDDKENNGNYQMDLHGVGDDESDDWANVLADVGTEHGETISLRSADISGTNCSISSPTTQANTDKFTDDC